MAVFPKRPSGYTAGMFATDSFLTFSFPAGRLFSAPLRLSVLLPVVVLGLMWRLDVAFHGLLASVILLFSLLVHEVAHLLMARRADHYPGTIVLWPLGSLQTAAPPRDFRSALSMALAGPVISLSIAAGVGSELARQGQLDRLMNPFQGFAFASTDDLVLLLLQFTFVVNWSLGIFNLIPIRPLDGGQALLAFLNLRFEDHESRDFLARLGLVITMFGLICGFVFDVSGLAALSGLLLILHIQEATEGLSPGSQRAFSDNEADQDADQGPDHSTPGEIRPMRRHRRERLDENDDETGELGQGIIDRWQARRDEERERRLGETWQAEQLQLDQILEKLHLHGRSSLTAAELAVLNRMSARLRDRIQPE